MAHPKGGCRLDLALLAASRETNDSLGIIKRCPRNHEPPTVTPYRPFHIDRPVYWHPSWGDSDRIAIRHARSFLRGSRARYLLQEGYRQAGHQEETDTGAHP